MSSNQLSPTDLRRAFIEFARPSKRPGWWGQNHDQSPVEKPSHAFGLMMFDLVRFRLRCLGHSDPSLHDACAELQKFVQDGDDLYEARYSEFLRGKSGQHAVFWTDAPGLLRRCLLGNEKLLHNDERALVAEKLVNFFFEHKNTDRTKAARNQREFFDPLYKFSASVQTPSEANAELDVLRYYLRREFQPVGKVLIVRASGYRRFLQRDDGEVMNKSGILTLKLLKEGAIVVYAYPKGQSKSPATQTAQAFRDFVQASADSSDALTRLHLIEVNPRALTKKDYLTGASFLSPTLRYGYLRCLREDMSEEDSEPLSRTLIVTQKARVSPSAYEPDRGEIDAFERWIEEFVLHQIGAGR